MLLNKIHKKILLILDLFEAIFAIAYFVVLIVSIVLFLIGKNNGVTLNTVSIFLLITLCIVFGLKIFKFSHIASLRLSVFSSEFQKISHLVSRMAFKNTFKNQVLGSCVDKEPFTLICENIVNSIEKILLSSSGYDFKVSIKVFADQDLVLIDPDKNETIKQQELITISTSLTEKSDKIIETLSNNSDLFHLAINSKPTFSTTNVAKFAFQYKKQTNENFLIFQNQNLSGTRIVSAVRAKTEKAPFPDRECFHLLGFICVDSQFENICSESELKAYTNVIETYSDLLFAAYCMINK
jgi:hypothetical protein